MGVQGGVGMELKKVTSKGQITISVEICRKLGIKDQCGQLRNNFFTIKVKEVKS